MGRTPLAVISESVWFEVSEAIAVCLDIISAERLLYSLSAREISVIGESVLQLNWEITATAYDNVVIPSWWGSYITGFPTPKDGYCSNLNVSWAKYNNGYYDKQCEGDAMIFRYDASNMSISIISRVAFNAADISNHLIVCHITGEYEV